MTISKLFLRTLCICLFSFSLLGLFLIWKDYTALAKDRVGQEVSVLAQATGTYHSTLVAMILNEDRENMERLLKQITKQEKLLSADIIASQNDFQEIFRDCNFKSSEIDSLYQIPSCAKVGSDSIEMFQEIQSFGAGIGFLHKRKALAFIQNFKLKYYFQGFLLWFGCVLFFILFYTKQLKRYLIKPLEYLSQNAPQVLTENLPLESKLAELDTLAKELGKAHTSLQRYKIQEIELETKGKLMDTAVRVAHDIRSPLSSMQTALEYFGQLKIKDAETEDILNLLQLSSKRLTGIADDLLKKYKGEDDDTNREFFSLHRILDELIGEYQGQTKFQNVRFVKQYLTPAIHIRGDDAKLQRAFGNIIKNAVEAMQYKGNITIRTETDKDNVLVSIRDSGPGMTSEKLSKVMGGGFTEGKKDGHGIGIKVAVDITLEHGGKLWAHSAEGEGTIFYFRFPMSKSEEAIKVFTLPFSAKGPVVVIDDDPSLREQWRILLKQQGLQSILCSSHEDFEKQKISSDLAQTAIVDYHFENSGKNGAEIIQCLRQNGFTHLILCTAEYWKPSIQKLTKEFDVALCPKPLPKISIAGHKAESEVKTPGESERRSYKVLVIDDDETIRLAWELMDRKLKIEKLHTFANLETLEAAMEAAKEAAVGPGAGGVENGAGAGGGIDLAAVDLAFVDKNILGSKFTGAQVVAFLKAKGVPKVILASGENSGPLRQNPEFALADFIVSEKIPQSFKAFFS